MKKKIIRVLDNLTDEFVPDKREAIMNAIENENVKEPAVFVSRKNTILKYATVAACFALLLISVLAVNIVNNDTPFFLRDNNPSSSITQNSGKNNTSNKEQNDVLSKMPVFNDGELNTLKIGGIAKETTEENAKKEYSFNSLPYNMKYEFLYPHNPAEAKPFACSISHISSDSWFNCIISNNELVDLIVEDYESTNIGDIEVVFSKSEAHLYSGFKLGEMNYLLEAEGLSEKDFVEIVSFLIS